MAIASASMQRMESYRSCPNIPLLSKEGQALSAGVVCSKSRSHLIDAREALLINRYCSTLNRPPQPSLCEGFPALLRRGMGGPRILLPQSYLDFLARFCWYGFVDEVAAGLRMRSTFQVRIT